MTRRARPTLRTRLLASLFLVSVVVLAIAGGVTYVFVQGTAERAAVSDLRSKAPTVQTTVTKLAVILRRDTGQLLADPNSGNADLFTLPQTLDAATLDPPRLQAGETVTGRKGAIAFLAEPLTKQAGRARLPVLVLTEPVQTDLPARAVPAFLLAAAAALVACVLVSLWLARRLVRPLAAVEATARVLASGDLSARVALSDRTEDEIAEVANALNVMAAQLEAARGSERAFLLSVSHDLRTPLTSIRGYAEALADGTLDGEDPQARRRAADVIMSESRRLERLVRDLLDLSRLDSHQFSLHPQAVDAGLVVRDAVEAFRPHADELGIALTVRDPSAMAAAPVVADLDPERLGQIVANLVENALKYARRTVDVGVTRSASTSATPGTVTITVSDDGPGIPPAVADRVFERLYTGRDGPGRSIGTGLGLAIVRELAATMGGTARVDPTDAGTRFVVTVRSGAVAG